VDRGDQLFRLTNGSLHALKGKSAPRARMMITFFLKKFSGSRKRRKGETRLHDHPRPIPLLPAFASTTVPPGFSFPSGRKKKGKKERGGKRGEGQDSRIPVFQTFPPIRREPVAPTANIGVSAGKRKEKKRRGERKKGGERYLQVGDSQYRQLP